MNTMDAIDVFLFALHKMLGHEVTARYLDQPEGDKRYCHLCHPELCIPECGTKHGGNRDE